MNWRRIFHKTWLWMILLGFNNCSRDRSSSQPLTGRALKVWNIFTTYCNFIFLTFSAFFSDIYCHTLLIGQRPHFICLCTCFCYERVSLTLKFIQTSLLELDNVNIFIKGLTWYGFKTVFNTTFMYIYVVSRNTVISTQFRYKQLTTKIGYCGFLIFASSQFR